MKKGVKKKSHTKHQKSNGERFKNVCIGIAYVGTMLFSYLELFLFMK